MFSNFFKIDNYKRRRTIEEWTVTTYCSFFFYFASEANCKLQCEPMACRMRALARFDLYRKAVFFRKYSEIRLAAWHKEAAKACRIESMGGNYQLMQCRYHVLWNSCFVFVMRFSKTCNVGHWFCKKRLGFFGTVMLETFHGQRMNLSECNMARTIRLLG